MLLSKIWQVGEPGVGLMAWVIPTKLDQKEGGVYAPLRRKSGV
jgi:hypothetical protein